MAVAGVSYEYETKGGFLTIRKTQDVEPIIKAVHDMPDQITAAKYRRQATRYIGSVPAVIGLQWAKEAGVRYLSKEWREVCVRKLKEPEWSKLKLRF